MLYPIMNVKDGLLFPLLFLAFLPLPSCTRTVYVPEEAVVRDGKYDTAFPRFEAADQLGVPLLGTSTCFHFYRTLQARGLGGEGNHAMIKALEHLAGLEVGGA